MTNDNQIKLRILELLEEILIQEVKDTREAIEALDKPLYQTNEKMSKNVSKWLDRRFNYDKENNELVIKNFSEATDIRVKMMRLFDFDYQEADTYFTEWIKQYGRVGLIDVEGFKDEYIDGVFYNQIFEYSGSTNNEGE